MPGATVPGLHSALWLWPQVAANHGVWPTSGDIDIGEFYSINPDRVVPFVRHTPASADPHVTNTECLVGPAGRLHDYVLEWTRRSLRITFVVALTQGLRVRTTANRFDPGATPVPATMQVDHVRVWR